MEEGQHYPEAATPNLPVFQLDQVDIHLFSRSCSPWDLLCFTTNGLGHNSIHGRMERRVHGDLK